MGRFDGKVALVTGAADGIGRATARRLAAEGAAVHGVDVDAAGLDETARAVGDAGATMTVGTTDVTDLDACRSAVADALAAHGRLDVLCNVAGVIAFGAFESIEPDAWRRVLRVNLEGTYQMCLAAIGALVESGGNIVNMASAAAIQATPYSVAYSASKGGVLMLTRSLAAEYRTRGVRVNCVCPGGVDTKLMHGVSFEGLDPAVLAPLLLVTTPIGPDEVAGAVAYLASDEARSVDGAALSIDNAQTAI